VAASTYTTRRRRQTHIRLVHARRPGSSQSGTMTVTRQRRLESKAPTYSENVGAFTSCGGPPPRVPPRRGEVMSRRHSDAHATLPGSILPPIPLPSSVDLSTDGYDIYIASPWIDALVFITHGLRPCSEASTVTMSIYWALPHPTATVHSDCVCTACQTLLARRSFWCAQAYRVATECGTAIKAIQSPTFVLTLTPTPTLTVTKQPHYLTFTRLASVAQTCQRTHPFPHANPTTEGKLCMPHPLSTPSSPRRK
jgi:hypothetical protein